MSVYEPLLNSLCISCSSLKALYEISAFAGIENDAMLVKTLRFSGILDGINGLKRLKPV